MTKRKFWRVILGLFIFWFITRVHRIYYRSIPETIDTHLIKDLSKPHFILYNHKYYSADARITVSGKADGAFKIAWEGSKDGIFRHVTECDYWEKKGKKFQENIDFTLPEDTLNKYREIMVIFAPENTTKGELKIAMEEKWYLKIKRECLRFFN